MKKDLLNLDTLKQLLVSFIIGIIIYISFISNNLSNQFDGLWFLKEYYSWSHDIAVGRFFWCLIDIVKQGIATDPFNSIIYILILSISNILLLKAIKIRKSILYYLIAPFLMCSVSTLCMMSYRYMSPTYAVAFLFSVISLYLFVYLQDNDNKQKYLYILVPIFLVLSLACYQSFIGCFCLGVLLYIVYSIINGMNFADSIKILIKAIVIVIISAILYKISWDLILKILNIEASSYKGANTLSVTNMILSFPHSLLLSYKYFFNYIVSSSFKTNIYNYKPYLLFLIVFIIYIVVYLRKTKNYYILIYLILLIPAANFSVLFENSSFELQQTYSTSILVPLSLFIMIDNFIPFNKKYINTIYYVYIALLSVLLVFGNFASVEIDVESMREGKRSVENIVYSIENELIDDGYYGENNEYYLIGIPSENTLFRTSDIWQRANEYAKFGKWWDMPHTSNRSYQGVIDDMGINIQCLFGSTKSFVDIVNRDYVKEMPLFPSEGSIIKEGNKVIIKISNKYSDYTE